MTPAALRPPTPRALEDERLDLLDRDAAATNDDALVAYEAKWQRKLRRLQRTFPERWRVAGLSDDEVRDRLTLRLIEAVRCPVPAELALQRPGREWGLLVVRLELRALRKSFRLDALSVDFRARDVRQRAHAPNQEEQWLDDEEQRCRAVAQGRAEQQLSRPQRRWLSALKLSARAGGFFGGSASPNLSAAARLLGKNRSSAQRSYRELQLRFGRELERLR